MAAYAKGEAWVAPPVVGGLVTSFTAGHRGSVIGSRVTSPEWVTP